VAEILKFDIQRVIETSDRWFTCCY